MPKWIDAAVTFVEAREAAEDELERNCFKLWVFHKVTDILLTGILGGTFITFWALWFLGRIN